MINFSMEIDEEELKKVIYESASNQAAHDVKMRLRSGSDSAKIIKEIIYENKDEIIDAVVERASKEIVKKALPKLLEKLKLEE